MKITIYTVILLAFMALNACTSEKGGNQSGDKKTAENQSAIYSSEGYTLMQQKCFICHLEKPDPEKMGSMIAPPMARIQEHYKPTYKNKDDFIKAVTAWVSNPSEEKAMMPGAVKNFNLMPHLSYPADEVKLIAAALYEMDFGDLPEHGRGMNRRMAGIMQGPSLNNGKKWEIHGDTGKLIEEVSEKLSSFKSDKLDDYHQLGAEIFKRAKAIILDNSYSPEVSDQLQAFFHTVEGNLHFLISASNLDDARKRQENLKNTFRGFFDYFEVK